jgi:hypothetical protein
MSKFRTGLVGLIICPSKYIGSIFRYGFYQNKVEFPAYTEYTSADGGNYSTMLHYAAGKSASIHRYGFVLFAGGVGAETQAGTARAPR